MSTSDTQAYSRWLIVTLSGWRAWKRQAFLTTSRFSDDKSYQYHFPTFVLVLSFTDLLFESVLFALLLLPCLSMFLEKFKFMQYSRFYATFKFCHMMQNIITQALQINRLMLINYAKLSLCGVWPALAESILFSSAVKQADSLHMLSNYTRMCDWAVGHLHQENSLTRLWY